MVSVARPWTKWSVQVERVQDLPAALRRAMQTALTPPTGPVFLSIPLDELVIFDGHTLDLAALDGVHGPLPFTGSMSVSSYGVDWYSNHLTGTLSIDFRPTE